MSLWFAVNVEAENEEEAIKKIHNCDYEEGNVSSEIDTMPEAYEMPKI